MYEFKDAHALTRNRNVVAWSQAQLLIFLEIFFITHYSATTSDYECVDKFYSARCTDACSCMHTERRDAPRIGALYVLSRAFPPVPERPNVALLAGL